MNRFFAILPVRSRRRVTGAVLILGLAGGLVPLLTGCRLFAPVRSTTQYYVLTSAPSARERTTNSLAIGLSRVGLPAYLFNSSVALRRGPNQIEYLPAANWAERLDAGIQRVLAANLSTRLGTDRVLLSAWEKSAVQVEVQVTIEQFDVDASGAAVLIARWRMVGPGGEPLVRAGTSRLVRPGAAANPDATQVAALMSHLVDDFSGELAAALAAWNRP
jgi:uncharacterized lipoprotein YmbA